MAELINITSFSVGSNGENLTASNTAFDTSLSNGWAGTELLKVTNSTTPNSVYSVGSYSKIHRHSATFGDRNITVKLTLKNFGGTLAASYSIMAQIQGADDMIEARYYASEHTVQLGKWIGGSYTPVISGQGVSAISATNDVGILELRITDAGTNNLSCSLWWSKNGGSATQVGTTQSITDSALYPIGKVGLYVRDGTASGQTTDVHITELRASDGVSGSSTTPLNVITPSQGVAFSSAARRSI